jgi:hypothetical protein
MKIFVTTSYYVHSFFDLYVNYPRLFLSYKVKILGYFKLFYIMPFLTFLNYLPKIIFGYSTLSYFQLFQL